MRLFLNISSAFLLSFAACLSGAGQEVPVRILNDPPITYKDRWQEALPVRPPLARTGLLLESFQEEPLSEQFQTILDSKVRLRLRGTGIVMAVRIPGRATWTGAAGYANRGGEFLRDDNGSSLRDEYRLPMREGMIRMQPDDLMQIGSCTKVIVATTIMRLVEDGYLSLDDTLERWLPSVNIPNADRITIRQMLDHSSGIFNYTNNPSFWEFVVGNRGWQSPWVFLDFVRSEEPYYEPGAQGEWEYSNTNYLLAGLAIESVAGRPLHDAMEQYIFEPLGLDEMYSAGLETVPPSEVVEYGSDGNPVPDIDWSSLYGAGHILASAENMVLFLDALFRGGLLQDESIEVLTTPQSNDFYGLGVFRFPVPEGPLAGTLLEHSGGTLGTTSLFEHHIESGITIFASHNTRETDNEPNPPMLAVFEALEAAIEAPTPSLADGWTIYQ